MVTKNLSSKDYFARFSFFRSDDMAENPFFPTHFCVVQLKF